MALSPAPAGTGPVSLSRCGDLQSSQQLGDEMAATTLALSTTCDAVRRLTEGYVLYVIRSYAEDKDHIKENEDGIYYELLEYSRELDWLLQQADGLRQKLLGTSQIVWNDRLDIRNVVLTSRTGFKLHGSG